MRVLNSILALLAVLLSSCATPTQKSGKPYDFCICGPTISAAGQPHCAVWGDNKNAAPNVKVWASEPRPSCEPTDCSQLFSPVCQKIQMSGLGRPTPPAPTNSCFCDAVLLENDKGQVQLACAAWAEGSKNLIEYYNLEDCSPQRCGEAPFVLAPKVCSNTFKAFYPPLLNKR
ncbi:MAG TPA: hypothetical protein VE954_19735 [Oligoflexus sp.]|uniref:hypothetical protein n=1 Tax=Oligoflexus sp. TaxID=1971216 RepID=UPI002D2425B8|nr:hypothetical protein [Oligoflexus sp.]HYX35334.1 hypothetical protein [Oligoflexus sp.]